MTEAKETKDEFVLEEDNDVDGLQIAVRSMDLNKLENADEAKQGGFNVKAPSDDDLFATKDASSGEGCMAVRPWIGSIVEPKGAPSNVTSLPDKKLELTWAYGYRGHDCTSNIVVNKNGQVIFPAASLIVAYDEKKHSQQFFQACNDDVVCLAQNPKNKNIVAAGQVATLTEGKRARQATPPHISVQDTTDPKASWKLSNSKVLQRVARAVSFSCDGEYLAVVGGDDNSTVSIWDWKKQTCVASAGNKGEMVLSVRWSNKSASSFVTVGVKHCCEWTFDATKNALTRNKVKTTAKAPLQTYYSIAYSEAKGVACVGARDGRVYFISGGSFAHVIPAHKGAVFSIDCCKAGMVTGGEDGKVNVYSADLKLQNTLSFNSAVKTVYVRDETQLVVGTAACEIYTLPSFTSTPAQPVVKGHCDGESWALAPSPTSGDVAFSAGEDNRVLMWNLTQHTCSGEGIINPKAGMKPKVLKAATMSKHPPNQCVRGLAVRPDGKEIAVGTNSGELNVYRASDLKMIESVDLNQYGKRQVTNQTQNWIEAVSYSPDGKWLAVGTHGIVTVILDVAHGYAKKDVVTKHNAAVTKIDWSTDSAFFQSTCRAYELLYFSVDASSGKATQVAPKGMSGVKWATQTCCFGWPVQGIFGNGTDMTEVNAVDASPDHKLLVTGDDYGAVNLFRYPCLTAANQKRIAKGHSSHVQNVKFTPDGRYVLSAGGNDKCILQWSIVNA